MGTMVYLFAVMPLTLYGAGAMFVRMCLVTTVGAIALGMLTQERAWCAICPMGTLQNLISRAAARVHVHVDAEELPRLHPLRARLSHGHPRPGLPGGG